MISRVFQILKNSNYQILIVTTHTNMDILEFSQFIDIKNDYTPGNPLN